MDGPRLSTSGRSHFSSRQTLLLQLGRFVGRCAGVAVGISSQGVTASSRHLSNQRLPKPSLLEHPVKRYFLVGAGDGAGGIFGEPCAAPCGAGVGGGFTSCNSTSKIRVEFGPMSGPIARSPYARVDGMNN